MKFGDVLTGIFILIMIYLVIVNWRGANALLIASGKTSIGLIKTLQGR